MNKTFIRQNVRLYPNKEQIQFLNQDIGNQRFV
ncbi:MAG: helix-turn-helix domain-containing protein, partial [Nanoarchaeota archaeon]|nr:helix-turn-helix domain-containing protein [Nanoarchaeota archaeon]